MEKFSSPYFPIGSISYAIKTYANDFALDIVFGNDTGTVRMMMLYSYKF